MKITPYHTYQMSGAARIAPLEKNAAAAIGSGADLGRLNVDRIDISSGAMRAEIEKSARTLTQQVTQPADAQRLEELRRAVRSNTYYVPTDRLVDAMMSWRML